MTACTFSQVGCDPNRLAIFKHHHGVITGVYCMVCLWSWSLNEKEDRWCDIGFMSTHLPTPMTACS